MASLADLLKQRVVNTSSMPVNVNNNIGMGYRGYLDPSNYKVTTRSGIVPPSIASRDMSVGFLKSPVVDTTGNILNFLTNKIARPTYNTFAETVNPAIENVAEALGYDRKNFFPFMGTQDIDFVKDQTTSIPQKPSEELTAEIAVFRTGLVSVLLVRVSVPANVAKSLSDNAVLNSAVVPVRVLLLRSIDLFDKVTVPEVTNAFVDCCEGGRIALSLAMLSSSITGLAGFV
jgi:hypothetical protein